MKGVAGSDTTLYSFFWDVDHFIILFAALLRLVVFVHELAGFSHGITRGVRTLWAGSFRDAKSVTEKLFSFEESKSAQAIPFYVPSAPIGAALLLCWARFRADWMICLGLLQLIERPTYHAWRDILRRLNLFTRENVDRWWASDKTKRRVVEVFSSFLFRVIPAIYAGLWVFAYVTEVCIA